VANLGFKQIAEQLREEIQSGHLARSEPKACDCHGLTYVFRGHRSANGAARQLGPKLVDVARRAGVSTGTVSTFLNRPVAVAEATRAKVKQAIADLGYVRGGPAGELAAHWRRAGFATWLFQPAATGRYPRKAPQPAHPVPVLAEPWPGVPLRGRNASGRADACWLPIAPGLTPPKLMDDRMGHEDGSVQARYSHVTAAMRRQLLDNLTERWEAALAARRAMRAESPVAVLDAFLRAP
jgi:hypothetical protein